MTSSTHLRNLLLRYLLGEMEPSEREEVDTALIADPDYAAALEDAQHDLLDAYAAGRLSSHEAERVQQAIAANAAFARAAEMAAALRLTRKQRNWGAQSRSRFHLPGWAIAACGLILAGGLITAGMWRFKASPSAKSTVAQNSPKLSAPPPAPATLTPPAPGILTVPAHRTTPALVATLLMPETSRSSEATPLQLQKGIQSLRVEWPVSADVNAAQPLMLTVFQDAKQVAQSQEVRPRHTISGTPVARFMLPSGKLSPGTYIFRIAASESSQTSQVPLVELTVEVKQS